MVQAASHTAAYQDLIILCESPKRLRSASKPEGGTHKAVVIDGVDVLLLGDEEAEAPARSRFEGDALGLLPQNAINIAPCVEFVRVALGHADGFVGVAVFNDDEVALPKKGPPLLQEVAVADGGDHNVDLVLQKSNVVVGAWSLAARSSLASRSMRGQSQ